MFVHLKFSAVGSVPLQLQKSQRDSATTRLNLVFLMHALQHWDFPVRHVCAGGQEARWRHVQSSFIVRACKGFSCSIHRCFSCFPSVLLLRPMFLAEADLPSKLARVHTCLGFLFPHSGPSSRPTRRFSLGLPQRNIAHGIFQTTRPCVTRWLTCFMFSLVGNAGHMRKNTPPTT